MSTKNLLRWEDITYGAMFKRQVLSGMPWGSEVDPIVITGRADDHVHLRRAHGQCGRAFGIPLNFRLDRSGETEV